MKKNEGKTLQQILLDQREFNHLVRNLIAQDQKEHKNNDLKPEHDWVDIECECGQSFKIHGVKNTTWLEKKICTPTPPVLQEEVCGSCKCGHKLREHDKTSSGRLVCGHGYNHNFCGCDDFTPKAEAKDDTELRGKVQKILLGLMNYCVEMPITSKNAMSLKDAEIKIMNLIKSQSNP